MSQLDLQRIIDRQTALGRQLDSLVGEVSRLQEFVRLLGERSDGATREPRPTLTLGKKKV